MTYGIDFAKSRQLKITLQVTIKVILGTDDVQKVSYCNAYVDFALLRLDDLWK